MSSLFCDLCLFSLYLLDDHIFFTLNGETEDNPQINSDNQEKKRKTSRSPYSMV